MFRKHDRAVGAKAEPPAVPEVTRDRAFALVRQRKTIMAIKVVREATGMSLKEAKTYVEALRDGLIPADARTWGVPPDRGMLSDRVRALLGAEDVDAAIALVSAETGLNRAEAQRFIAALD